MKFEMPRGPEAKEPEKSKTPDKPPVPKFMPPGPKFETPESPMEPEKKDPRDYEYAYEMLKIAKRLARKNYQSIEDVVRNTMTMNVNEIENVLRLNYDPELMAQVEKALKPEEE